MIIEKRYTVPVTIWLYLLISLPWSALNAGDLESGGQRTLQILTLPPGSLAYRAGATLAAAISRSTDYQAIVAGYGGAQVILPMLEAGRAEFALLNANDVALAFRGTAPFRRAHTSLRIISNAYLNVTGVVVAQDSPIRSLADIRGKRVTGVFSQHKTCEELANAQMANMGLGRSDVRIVPVANPVSSIQALAEGRADVALCVAPGIPAALEADARIGIRYLSLDPSPEASARLRAVFNAGKIARPGNMDIPDLNQDGYFLVYDYYLIGSRHISDEMVREVLQVLWDQQAALAAENNDFVTWTHERMPAAQSPVPYHDAAAAFFRSHGGMTDNAAP